MFTQFSDHTVKTTLTPTPNTDWQKWELAISEIQKIVDSRIAYNQELVTFVREASMPELEAYCQTVQKVNPSIFAFFTDDAKKMAFKVSIIGSIQEDIAFYDKIKKIILEKPHNQEMIDELHCEFSKEYKFVTSPEIAQFLKEPTQNKAFENVFLKEAIDKLEPLISAVESEFMSVHEFTFNRINHVRKTAIECQFSNKSHVIGRYLALNERFGKSLRLYAKRYRNASINDTNKDLLGLFSSLKTVIQKIPGMGAAYTENPGNIWRMYRDDCEEYCNALKVMQEVESHPLLYAVSTEQAKKSKNARKQANRRQKLKDAKKINQESEVVENATPPDSMCQETQSSCLLAGHEQQTLVFEQAAVDDKNESEAGDTFALKLEEWKAQVAQCRAAKQHMLDGKHRGERLRFEQQKKCAEGFLANKKEREYKNACELLGALNPNNRTLIEQMFQKSTLNCKIRYQEIESLFGEDTGKLPGTITSVSGSHRRISIQSTIGFFDEFYVAEANETKKVNKMPADSELENKTKRTEVVGGMFKAHKSGQGNSMLPSVAIKMVCSTLERVGITAENIAHYKQEQASQKTTLKTD